MSLHCDDRDAPIIFAYRCYYTAHNIIGAGDGRDRCNNNSAFVFGLLLYFLFSAHRIITSSYTFRYPLSSVADSRTGHRRDGDKDVEPPPPDEDSRPPAAAAIARRTGIRCPLPLSTAAGGERSVDASSGLHHHTPPSVARHG